MTLADYLYHLAIDSIALARFNLDPDASMEDARLSASDRHLIKSGSTEKIQAALRGGRPELQAQVIVTFLKITIVPIRQ